jgi:hypothetical protein
MTLSRTIARAARCLTIGAAAAALLADPAFAQKPAPVPNVPAAEWPIRTREHVDLWLHGMAMLIDDTTRVPLFRRGYAEDVRAARLRAKLTTRLDAERDRLRARFAANPTLPLAAQFIPFAFDSWESLRRAADVFQQTGGDPRRAGDQATANAIALLAGTFTAPADREWLRIFVGALDDESTRFYHGYWAGMQTDRAAARTSVDSAWNVVRPKLQRFLTNSQQRSGDILLSLPLGGEGRTSNVSTNRNIVAVNFPATSAAAAEAIYTAIHELMGSTAGPVVADNVTPAEQRSGVADRYVSAAQVRGGLLLLQRAAPEFAAGYARYYLSVADERTTGDPIAALAAAFPLPAGIADALARQIEIILAGI